MDFFSQNVILCTNGNEHAIWVCDWWRRQGQMAAPWGEKQSAR